MHWTDEAITEFLDKLVLKNILILLVHQAYVRRATEKGVQNGKMKIKIGGFATLSFNKEPLNKYNPKLIYIFRNREVLLIEGG